MVISETDRLTGTNSVYNGMFIYINSGLTLWSAPNYMVVLFGRAVWHDAISPFMCG